MNRRSVSAHWPLAAAIAGSMFIAAATPAEADKDEQKDRGRRVPEVPVAALLPAASVLAGGGYYLVARLRTARRPRHTDDSRSDRSLS